MIRQKRELLIPYKGNRVYSWFFKTRMLLLFGQCCSVILLDEKKTTGAGSSYWGLVFLTFYQIWQQAISIYCLLCLYPLSEGKILKVPKWSKTPKLVSLTLQWTERSSATHSWVTVAMSHHSEVKDRERGIISILTAFSRVKIIGPQGFQITTLVTSCSILRRKLLPTLLYKAQQTQFLNERILGRRFMDPIHSPMLPRDIMFLEMAFKTRDLGLVRTRINLC